MLTGGTGGNSGGPGNTGDSLLEEINRDEESQENTGVEDDINTDDKQAWINAERYVYVILTVDEPNLSLRLQLEIRRCFNCCLPCLNLT